MSTVIPGLRTSEQVKENVNKLVEITDDDRKFLEELNAEQLENLVGLMQKQG